MRVQLDEEVMEMSDSARLEEVLARISDSAEEKGRLVTKLMVGDQSFTDRDLLPSVLSQPARMFGMVVATSQTMQSIVDSGADSARKMGASLQSEGQDFVHFLRKGERRYKPIDDWFGRLADYVEWAELARSHHASQAPTDSIAGWLQEMIQARESGDIVRLADVLEFEVIPRLPNSRVSSSVQNFQHQQ